MELSHEVSNHILSHTFKGKRTSREILGLVIITLPANIWHVLGTACRSLRLLENQRVLFIAAFLYLHMALFKCTHTHYTLNK